MLGLAYAVCHRPRSWGWGGGVVMGVILVVPSMLIA